ncbi:hypothetical protein, partial [Xanthomonas phaseoli]|uniref:hypothetical protein n=1 Tax=Xanthomonas phaseoli TaxID=1985254 RepID=UPI001D0C66AA
NHPGSQAFLRRGSMCGSTRYWCLSAENRVTDLLTHGKLARSGAAITLAAKPFCGAVRCADRPVIGA